MRLSRTFARTILLSVIALGGCATDPASEVDHPLADGMELQDDDPDASALGVKEQAIVNGTDYATDTLWGAVRLWAVNPTNNTYGPPQFTKRRRGASG